MASPCGSCISGLSITSTIIRATYPPGHSGHISSGEERLTGTADACAPPGTQRTRRLRDRCVREPQGRLAGAGDPSPRPGKEWHVTVESGAATTAALSDEPVPEPGLV